MSEACPVCHASYSLVGLAHRCVGRTAQAIAVPSPAVVGSIVDVAKQNGVAKRVAKTTSSSTYRYRNPDERRAYMRDYMRRRAAKLTAKVLS